MSREQTARPVGSAQGQVVLQPPDRADDRRPPPASGGGFDVLAAAIGAQPPDCDDVRGDDCQRPERVAREEEHLVDGVRRRKALMARQSGQRLADERKQRGLTQAQLAETMGVTPGRVSQIERGELSTIEAIARYVQALGGRLDLVANFTDHTLTVTTTDAA
jgi:DNA-binding XRE family transcriptional regulator